MCSGDQKWNYQMISTTTKQLMQPERRSRPPSCILLTQHGPLTANMRSTRLNQEFVPIKILRGTEAWPRPLFSVSAARRPVGRRPAGVVSRSRPWFNSWGRVDQIVGVRDTQKTAACNVRSFWLMPLTIVDSTMSRTTWKSHTMLCPGRRGRVARNNARECTPNKMLRVAWPGFWNE